MQTPDIDRLRRENEKAWDVVSDKYALEVAADVDLLRVGGERVLLPVELPLLRPLLHRCRRAIHLQCSHGTSALALWRLGASEVVGLDLSSRMLELARRKTELLHAPATWYHADVLAPPKELSGTADLVYTGGGALPWVLDLDRWARVVADLLVPGGHLFIHEGHPLNWVWSPKASRLELREDADYFAREERANDDFPGVFLKDAAAQGAPSATAFERQWPLGEIVTALARAGLTLVSLTEHPEHFWPQFPEVPESELHRLPHSFSLVMQRPRSQAGTHT